MSQSIEVDGQIYGPAQIRMLRIERDVLRETVKGIECCNVDEHGRPGDMAIKRLIDSLPDAINAAS